jgi:hypothetical protein
VLHTAHRHQRSRADPPSPTPPLTEASDQLSTASARFLEVSECCFSKLKQFRRVATRFEKTARNYLAVVTLAATILWLKVSVHRT